MRKFLPILLALSFVGCSLASAGGYDEPIPTSHRTEFTDSLSSCHNCPHFEGVLAVRAGDHLVVAFAEDDVRGQSVAVLVTATANVTDWCVNKRGRPHTSVTFGSPVAVTAVVPVDNDDAQGSVVLDPPAPTVCRHHRRLIRVMNYSNIRVLDLTNNVSTTVEGIR